MWLSKSAYWNTNSFSRDPRSDMLWLTLIELNLLALSPQSSGVASGAAPYGCEFWVRPERAAAHCAAVRIAVALPVKSVSRYGVGVMPSCDGNSPLVETAWVV